MGSLLDDIEAAMRYGVTIAAGVAGFVVTLLLFVGFCVGVSWVVEKVM